MEPGSAVSGTGTLAGALVSCTVGREIARLKCTGRTSPNREITTVLYRFLIDIPRLEMSQLLENKREGYPLIANKPIVFAESYTTGENRTTPLLLGPVASSSLALAQRGMSLMLPYPAWFLESRERLWQIGKVIPAVVFLFGLINGSFLNVCIRRIPAKVSVVHPASRCPAGGAPIKPYDNIPVISYLLLR